MDAEILRRAETADGEVVLRRRGEVVELIVNGVFAMDTVDVSSELALADAAGAVGRVLVGGLGLGYTAVRLLERGAELDVVERAGPLLEWAREGVTAQLGRLATDPRARLHHADIVSFVTATTQTWDAIVLDVDNGPSFLIHADNAEVYTEGFLRTCLARLAPHGTLLIWCETASPPLEIALRRLAAGVQAIEIPVAREGREFGYTLYRADGRPKPHGSTVRP
ncbi:MAG: methyltransferase [Propionicimonas sp.]